MTPERWQQVKGVLQNVLELAPSERAAFLDQACDGDQGLRQEVESLLASDEQGRSSFLQSPPSLKLVRGTRLGDYEIQSLLGAGGMGEVYRARDLRLRRDVAIKVLPAFVASDPERLRRFEQEATAGAALNHPNILAVHQMGTFDGAPYLVAELLEGETLREQMKRGPMAVHRAMDYGIQIARGLAAAHEKGIVHRDLKPENLFVTKDGRVKILDFGLAKLMQPQPGAEHSALTLGGETEAGVVIGTVGYMAPEQVRGQAADHRADIFAFGAILYEALAGKRAFRKPTSPETMTAILNEDPPGISQVVPNLPPALQRVVHRCLEKNPEQRFQSASDLAFALEALSGSAASVTFTRPSRSKLAGFVAALLAAVSVLTWSVWPSPVPRVANYTQLTNDGADKLDVTSIGSIRAPIVTDGSRLYFSETLRGGADSISQVLVTGGETAIIPTPFPNVGVIGISPSGSDLLAYTWQANEVRVPLWVVPVLGGSPRRVGEVTQDATWSADGQIVYTHYHDLYVAQSDGTGARKLVTVAGLPVWPRWSPDGKVLRFTEHDPKKDSSSLWEVSADGTQLRPVLPDWSNHSEECCGNWTPDGKYFVFQSTRNGRTDLWAIREKQSSWRKADREPVQLTAGPMSLSLPLPDKGGKKLFALGTRLRGELVRYDAKSAQFVPYMDGISATDLAFSRGGDRVAYVAYAEGILWRSKTDGSERSQLTFPPLEVRIPRWSPEGRRIVFMGRQPGQGWRIYLVASEGGSSPKELLPGNDGQAAPDWSPDGNSLVFGGFPEEISGDASATSIHLLDLKTNQTSMLPGSEGMYCPRWSPDGLHISATSADGSKLMLFDITNRKWEKPEVLPEGCPAWSHDGKYLYFQSFDEKDAAFFRVRISDRKRERIAGIDLRRAEVDYFWWNGLAPDDSPLVLRNESNEEIYALDWPLP